MARVPTMIADPESGDDRSPPACRENRFLPDLPWSAADRILLVSIVLVSFLLRLRFLNEGLFHPDEVALARAVEGSWDSGTLVSAFNGRYGSVVLNLLFYVPWHLATGLGAERIVPFTAALTGSLLAAAVYLLSRELFGSRTAAALSAFFLGFNFLCLTTSTTGKENTHGILFVTAGMYLLALGWRKGSRAIRYAGFALGALAATMHEATVPLLAVVLVLAACLAFRDRRPDRNAALELFAGFLILALPCIAVLRSVIVDAATSRGSSTIPAFRGIFSGILPHALGDLAAAAGWPLLLLAAAGAWAAKRYAWISLFLPAWLLLILYFGNVSTYTPRYLVHLMVPLSLLAGLAGGRLSDRIPSRAASLLAAAGLAAAVCGYGLWNAYPLVSQRSAYSGPKRMALFARERTEPGAVIITMDASVFYDYYGKRAVESHPVSDEDANRRFVERLRGMAEAGKSLYVDTSAFSYDKEGGFYAHLSETFRLEPVGTVVGEGWNDSELAQDYFADTLYRLTPLRKIR